MVQGLPTTALSRPLRVVLFCGPVIERPMVRFASLLDRHAEVELARAFCQTQGLGLWPRLRDLFGRRGLVALPLLGLQTSVAAARWIAHPGFERELRRHHRQFLERLELTTDLHRPEVLERVRELEPDLGVIYGGPILRPELFEIPRFGTLGIHHGTLPDYRGKKTTFWALHNGEARAGVTIQRINAGVDTGELVRHADVPVLGRGYFRVEHELEELGLDLYLDAVVGVKRGTTRAQPIIGQRGRLYRDPQPAQLLRYLVRGCIRRMKPKTPPTDAALREVLLFTESFHPMIGGGETQARALARSLAEAGRAVTVVTRRWEGMQPAFARVDGLPVQRIGPAGSGHLKKWGLALTALGPIFARRRADPVLLVNGFRVLGIPASLAAQLFPVRVILKADSPGEISGSFFDPGLRKFGLSHRSLAVRWLLSARNRLLRRADAFVAISSALAEEFESNGIEPERIHRIPNGIDPQHFRPAVAGEQTRLREALELPIDAELVIYTGRLVRYKGLPGLLRAWSDVALHRRRAHLVLVGSGSADIDNCEAELRHWVREQGLGDRVSFTGAVENVAEYLRAADVFVFPTMEEAFGLAALEAMASGIAVVSTRTGGLADFISEGNGAIVVEAGNDASLTTGLLRALEDRSLREQLGERGRRAAVENYSLDAVRDRYLALVDALSAARVRE